MKPFTIYVPAGWMRFDLPLGVAAGSRAYAVTAAARASGSVRAAVRGQVEITLERTLTELAGGGAVAAFLPTQESDWGPVAAMAVVMPVQSDDDSRPLDLVLALASADESAQLVDLPGLVALRTTSTGSDPDLYAKAAAQAQELLGGGDGPVEGEIPAASVTRVRYLLGSPTDSEKWADLLFSVQAPATPLGQELTEAAVGLFDAMVSTFAWVEEEAS